jgi:hypothetical protein
MDTVVSGLYQEYVNFAENLEKRLVATYGRQRANRFFQRMDQARFEAICEAASFDPLKRQWLTRLKGGWARVLDGGKTGEAA